MADIQILSGLAILISSFISMPCGISAFHWQIIVYLAWFSSLTHLAVLTFLRQRLYHWRPMRAWRLIAMAALMILLMVALVPTARIEWPPTDAFDNKTVILIPDYQFFDFAPNRYAVCSFKDMSLIDPASLASAIISMVVIFSGFIVRVIKLHRTLSDALQGVRRKVSGKFTARLDQLHSWTHDWPEPCELPGSVRLRWKRAGMSLKRNLVYQPACATVITTRAAVDAFTSTFYEARRQDLGNSTQEFNEPWEFAD